MKMNEELTPEDRKVFEDEPEGIGQWALEIIDAQAACLTAAQLVLRKISEELDGGVHMVAEAFERIDSLRAIMYRYNSKVPPSLEQPMATNERAGKALQNAQSALDEVSIERRLVVMSQQLSEKERELAESNARILKKQNLLECRDIKIATVEHDRNAALVRVAELESQLKAANIDADQNGEMADAANARIAELAIAERLARATAASLKEALRQTDAALMELKRELLAANVRVDEANREISEWRHAYDMGLVCQQNVESEAASLREELLKSRAHAKFAEDEHGNADVECDTLTAKLERLSKPPRPKCTCGDDYVAVMAAHDIGCPVVSTQIELPVTTIFHNKMPEYYGHESSSTHYVKSSSVNDTCDECGATHGPGNTNRLCPKASNYSPELEAQIERQWDDGMAWTGLSLYDPDGNVSELQLFELREWIDRMKMKP